MTKRDCDTVLRGRGERGRLSLLKLDKEQRHLHTEFVTMNDEQ
jgi:hypothetical protein